MRLNRETVNKVGCAAVVIGTGKVAALDIVYCIIAPSTLEVNSFPVQPHVEPIYLRNICL